MIDGMGFRSGEPEAFAGHNVKAAGWWARGGRRVGPSTSAAEQRAGTEQQGICHLVGKPWQEFKKKNVSDMGKRFPDILLIVNKAVN